MEQTIDDVMDQALDGLWVRLPNEIGDMEFVALDDRYGIERKSLKEDIADYIKRSEMRALAEHVSDVARAVGFIQGLGHTDPYLEQCLKYLKQQREAEGDGTPELKRMEEEEL